MGRHRYVVVALVVASLVLPGWSDGHAQTSDNESACGFGSKVAIQGEDGGNTVATYTLNATWCVERVFSTTTETVPDDTSTSSSSTSSPSTMSAAATTALEKAATDRQYEAARKKKRRGRRNKKSRNKDSNSERTTRTRTVQRRRLVSTCMTDFRLEVVPSGVDEGVDFLGATTKETTTSSCSAHSFRIQGRFGRDYVRGFPTSSGRTLISQSVGGMTIENYLLGRVGYFDVSVVFNRDGPPSCTDCTTAFDFCDLRLFDTDDPKSDTCIRL